MRRQLRSPTPPRAHLAFVGAAALALGGAALAVAQEPGPGPDDGRREQRIRALFLKHFCKYVRWPESAFVDGEAPLVIGIVGSDPLGLELDDVMADARTEEGRRVVVRRFGRHADLGDDAILRACHILLVTEPDPICQGKIIHALERRPTLVVAEAPGFADAGGCVQTFVADNKLRFEVNRAAVERAGLSVSSKLLRLSREAPARRPADGHRGSGNRGVGPRIEGGR